MTTFRSTYFVSLAFTLLLGSLAACDEAPARPPGDGSPGLPDLGAWEGIARTDGPQPADAGPPPDGAQPDGPAADGPTPPPDSSVPYPARYPLGRRHSPLTPYVVTQLKKALTTASRDGQAFSKIGNSITVSTGFMHCFAGSAVDLDGRTQLTPTIAHFKKALADGKNSFNRTSLCATVGWAALHALKGTPTPLAQEVSAISPRFAVVMYGSNDIGWNDVFGYANNMLEIADRLLADGVIPIMSSIPPRDDSASANAQVPLYNMIVRGIAQALQVPFVDFHQELLPLPSHGLGGDKLHPNSSPSGSCNFTAAGLQYGYNVRNLLELEALDRVKRAVLDGEPAPDAPGSKLSGDGSPQKPWLIDSLPFTHMANTAASPHKNIASYSGCSSTADESGPEYLYKLVLTKSTTLHALVFDRGSVDIDLHLLDSSASAAGCIERAHQQITRTLAAGTYYLSLDTFVQSGTAQSGEYLLVVLAE